MVSHNALHYVPLSLDRSPPVINVPAVSNNLAPGSVSNSDVGFGALLSSEPSGCSPVARFGPVALAGGHSEPGMNSTVGVVNCNSPTVLDVGVNLLDVDVSLLSPNAIMFIPSCLVDGFGPSDVIVESLAVGLMAELASAPIIGATSYAEGGRGSGGSLVLGVVEPNGCGQVFNKLEGGAAVNLSIESFPVVLEAEPPSSGVSEECIPIVNRLIEVPVNEIDTQAMAKCLGDSSGVEIRDQLNWLIVSSDGESESDSSEGGLMSENDNDFSLVCSRPSLIGAARGRFWGRGRRRR
ncbi:hypothetical protein MA16_Dca016082 [Dendrobium catenatum]|uniref:Uncharacterized protein n=1 Tax=Dendrobium catenatum TaxID=906689 RepID=A0A2I0WIW8_9ASPA|nr:hypothetical protein MA16_Dca016082 [Dendrobium catenatum]